MSPLGATFRRLDRDRANAPALSTRPSRYPNYSSAEVRRSGAAGLVKFPSSDSSFNATFTLTYIPLVLLLEFPESCFSSACIALLTIAYSTSKPNLTRRATELTIVPPTPLLKSAVYFEPIPLCFITWITLRCCY